MTLAAAIDGQSAQPRARAAARRIARVDIAGDMASVETLWRGFEAEHVATPFQRFDFVAAWFHHVGPHEHATPLIAIARDADGQPLMLLPLAVTQRHGLRIGEFPGGKHSTFNMPMIRSDFAAGATQADFDELLRALRADGRIDALALVQQPHTWLGLTNPLAHLPHQPSVNDCPLLVMTPNAPPAERISNSFRRRLKGKERKLQSLPGYRSYVGESETDITRLLDAFFTIKPQRMAEQKLPDVFADPGVEAFLRAACLAQRADGRHAIEIHALECDAEVIALFAGVTDGHRFSMMFNTYTMSENARYSPGLILMRDIIDHYAALGYTALDLGVGATDYKRLFCKDDEPLFDAFVPLSARGQLGARGLASLARAKRYVKGHPKLMDMVQRLRSRLRY